jgi:hypothetical protein
VIVKCLPHTFNYKSEVLIYNEEKKIMKKASSSIKNLLSKNGYSENTIEEICRWYSCSARAKKYTKKPQNKTVKKRICGATF